MAKPASFITNPMERPLFAPRRGIVKLTSCDRNPRLTCRERGDCGHADGFAIDRSGTPSIMVDISENPCARRAKGSPWLQQLAHCPAQSTQRNGLNVASLRMP